MLFQRINRSNPEKVFIVAYNSEGTTTVSNGQLVQWDFTTDHDGVGFIKPTARATNGGFAACGVVAETIAGGSYGLVQVYGYHATAQVRAMTGSAKDIVPGTPLSMSAVASYCLESFATGSAVIQVFPCAFSLGTLAAFTSAATAVFIKAL